MRRCIFPRLALALAAAVTLAPEDGAAIQLPLPPTLLADINHTPSPVVYDSSPGALGEVGGLLYLRATSSVAGPGPWVTDGTAAGTQLLSDVAPGIEASWPHGWHRAGGTLLFAADDKATGWEQHAAPLAALGGWVAEPYGTGCGASIGFTGQAVLGANLSVDATTPAPFAPAALFYSASQGYTSLGAGCTQLLASPQLLATATADASGQVQHTVTVPVNPALVGKAVHLQYAALYVGAPLLSVLALSDGLELIVGP